MNIKKMMINKSNEMPKLKTSEFLTIDRHIANEEDKHPEATGEFTLLLHDLTFALRLIAKEVRRAGLNDILGMTENVNVHGEKVRRLDEYAHDAIYRSMVYGGHLCGMVSEESKEIIRNPSEYKRGKYILVFDPIDGSTNIDVNITIGTIFSLYKINDPDARFSCSVNDILQPGWSQAAAGYALYGSSTMLVYTTGHGVNVFTYDPSIGEFLVIKQNVKIPKRGCMYSCNEGNFYFWDEGIRNYITSIKKPSDEMTKPYSHRYVASIVADMHRTLLYGGIYLYPPDKAQPNGKIRIVYEGSPLAMIIEQAGGRAIDGKQRILDIKPDSIHQRTPFYAGSPENIDELESFLNK